MAETRLSHTYDSEEFRKHGHELIDILADYLKEATSRSEMPVLDYREPDDLVGEFDLDDPANRDLPLDGFIRKVVAGMNHLHHPRFVGHQNTPPLTAGIIAQMCTTLLNNGVAVYEMGPASMAAERNVIRYMSKLIGFGSEADGIFTHGGSAGNLTGLLAARQAMSEYNVWEEGVRNDRPVGIIVSDQSHYSISRNAKVIGLGGTSVIRIPYDSRYAMKTDLLEETMRRAEEMGIRVICVAANACSTATGTYDNLEEIAAFCRDKKLWFHVDGAHGLGVLFSQKYRHLVRGLDHADSVVLDFHKMLLTPGLNTMVLFRDGSRSYETFAQKAGYLFEKHDENEWYNGARRTLECTKSALGIVAWAVINYYGREALGKYVESRYDLAARFADAIKMEPGMELAVTPESNIVCFRYAPDGISGEKLNGLNRMIRKALVHSGEFYIVQTELNGKIWLRTALMNAVTDDRDLERLIGSVKRLGTELAGQLA
ncbi:MAG: aminotransferase class I/II-fold pyridoxal phosphate-dependent enzyme [Bacteroidota bacterium]|nr:aminotransferase class I/II-fold pyridoxal phosphate-dependent enzyme [Bacteroidota bacterium]